MSKYQIARYKDAQLYMEEIEEVYDLTIHVEYGTNIRASDGMASLVLSAYDKDDEHHEDGPLYYHLAWIAPKPEHKRQQGIIRALTELTRQCFEAYCERGQSGSENV